MGFFIPALVVLCLGGTAYAGYDMYTAAQEGITELFNFAKDNVFRGLIAGIAIGPFLNTFKNDFVQTGLPFLAVAGGLCLALSGTDPLVGYNLAIGGVYALLGAKFTKWLFKDNDSAPAAPQPA